MSKLGLGRWLSGWRCLLPRLTTQIQLLGPVWWTPERFVPRSPHNQCGTYALPYTQNKLKNSNQLDSILGVGLAMLSETPDNPLAMIYRLPNPHGTACWTRSPTPKVGSTRLVPLTGVYPLIHLILGEDADTQQG